MKTKNLHRIRHRCLTNQLRSKDKTSFQHTPNDNVSKKLGLLLEVPVSHARIITQEDLRVIIILVSMLCRSFASSLPPFCHTHILAISPDPRSFNQDLLVL